jgi:hypothetical protein
MRAEEASGWNSIGFCRQRGAVKIKGLPLVFIAKFPFPSVLCEWHLESDVNQRLTKIVFLSIICRNQKVDPALQITPFYMYFRDTLG